jgi:NitT/TauT family transport system substrate-binding protein
MRAALAVLVALALGAGAARAADPLAIHVGWVTFYATSVPLSLERKDLLKHYGKSYTIVPHNVRSTSAMTTALASGEVHVGTLAYSSLGFTIQNAKLDDIRIVSGATTDGVGNHNTTQFQVLKDSPIRRVEDLKGKVLASLAKGSAVDIAIRAMLRKHGLDDVKDVQFLEAQFANMKGLLLDKRVDLISSTLPFVEDPQLKANARTLFTQKDAVGSTQMLVWSAREGFLQKNRAAMVDFLEDSLRFMRYLQAPANNAEVVQLVAKAMKQPPSLYEGWLFTERDSYRDPNMMPDLDSLQRSLDLQRQLGFLEQPIEVKKYAALDLMREAAARVNAR